MQKKEMIALAVIILTLFLLIFSTFSLATGQAYSKSKVIAEKQNRDLSQFLLANLNTESINTNLLQASITECQDSDNGLNLGEKGVFLNYNQQIVEDSCESDGSKFLQETICTPGCNCQLVWEECKFGTRCYDGKCTLWKASGEDTDTIFDLEEDYNIFKKGSYVFAGSTLEDSCIDDHHIKEYNAFSVAKEIACPAGTRCVDGACTKENLNCNSLIYSNDAAKKKYNLVFVGTDYHLLYPNHQEALEAFLRDVRRALGLDGKSYGLFSIEPYKSSLSQFNLWYIDRFAETKNVEHFETMTSAEVERRKLAEYAQMGLASRCQLGHKIIVSLDAKAGWNLGSENLINLNVQREIINEPEAIASCVNRLSSCYSQLLGQTQESNLPIIDLNNDHCLGGKVELPYPKVYEFCQDFTFYHQLCRDDTPEELNEMCSSNYLLGETLAHEMSHIFGLADISASKTQDLNQDSTTINIGSTGTFPNCYLASSVEECNEHAPWKFLLGKGCGVESIIDCNEENPRYNQEIICQPGCLYGFNSYRSVRYNIMPYGTALDGIPYQPTHILGLWDEYYIKQKINAYLNIGLSFFSEPNIISLKNRLGPGTVSKTPPPTNLTLRTVFK